MVPSAIDGFAGVTASEVSTAAVIVSVVLLLMLLAESVAVMIVEPTETLVARPSLPDALLTVAPDVFEEPHVTELLRSCVLPSLKVPVAVSCCVVPKAIDGFVGVTASDVSTAAVTVSVVLPLMLLAGSVAVIVAEPTDTLIARPSLPDALLTVAAPDEELQVTELVRFWVLASLYVPVAVNCSVVPSAIDGFVGVTVTDISTAAVIVSVVLPLMLVAESVAVMVVEPTETLVARASLPEALLTVATPVLEELHVTELVRSWVLASL